MEYSSIARASPDLNPTEHAFHLLKTKLQAERPTNMQQQREAKGLAKHLTKANPVFGDVYGFSGFMQSLTVKDLQTFIKYKHHNHLFVCQTTFQL